MKNVFGSPYEKGRKEPRYDGERFVVRRSNADFDRELDELAENALGFVADIGLPKWLSVIKWICGAGALLIATGILKALADISIEQVYANAPYLFFIGAPCLIIWLVLFVAEKSKLKNIRSSGKLAELNEKAESLTRRSEEELDIPHDAAEVDILCFEYTEKNGKQKVKKEFGSEYSNTAMRLFAEDGNICLADLNTVYSFTASDFKKFVLKKKKAVMDDWNKDEPFNKGEYKKYKITSTDAGSYMCKFYALQFSDVFGEYEIFFPEYELKHFEQILSLPIEEEQ